MTPELRAAAAHVLVDDVAVPVLEERDAHHVFRVLRVRDGERVTVTDGAGHWRACVASGGAIEPTGESQMIPPRRESVTVAFAIPKQDRPEWIVQKLTELGVDRIVLLHAERSVVRWPEDRAAKHLAKLRRVAAEALQQSRGVWLPTIDGPVAAGAVLADMVAADPAGEPLAGSVSALAIGPEGGWSDTELATARGLASIGAPILRVETSAIVAGARMVQHAE